MTTRRLASTLVAAAFVATAAPGPTLAAESDAKPLMRDFIGINGHTIQFNPELYAPLCRLVRDYHPYLWDIDGTSDKLRPFPVAQHIDWEDSKGNFRPWHAPVNWHELYDSWKKEGFEIDACIQMGAKAKDFKDLAKDSYAYGKAFAEYFGPSHHNLVTSVEIGNEPAGNKAWSEEDYKTLFVNMARGVREADPKLKILTCTTEAGETDGWSMPTDLFKDTPELYDVLNVHKYALKSHWPAFERTYPENSSVNYPATIQKTIDWRDANAPDKEVWITEFGYDASTKEPAPDNAQWKDSTDLQQAQWIIRSFLVFSGMDLDRAYLYWFNDSDTPSFHAASGVTRNFVPKPSYWAMKHLYASLGDYRFSRAVEQNPEGAWVFEYVNGKDASDVVVVAWSATGDDRTLDHPLQLTGKLVKAERMPTTENEDTTVKLAPANDGRVTAQLTESPLYVWLKR